MAKRVNAEEFEAEVLKASLPVIVEFYSDSCIPCKQLSPVLGGIEDDYGPGNIIIYRVLTNLDRRDGNPFRYISIARKSKSDDWKIINSGF